MIILPLPEIYFFWDPREETTPLREMMKLEVTGNCFIKADPKLTPKKVMHGSRRQLVQDCDNCSAYIQSLYQVARLCCKLTFPVSLCF